MDNIRLPDLSRLKDIKQRLKELPPQKSASDTSNWENRKIYTPEFVIDDKERIAYYTNALLTLEHRGLTLEKIRQIQIDHNIKPSK